MHKTPGFFIKLSFFAIAIFLFANPVKAMADNEEEGEAPFDEISVFLNVRGVGGTEMPALIKGQTVYLSISDVFNFLKIRNIADVDKEIVSGFFISQDESYLIDNINSRITFQQKVFDLNQDDILRNEGILYLKSTIYGKVFGLNCNFNFRDLSVELNTPRELPAIREMKQASMRQNVSSLKGEIIADTTFRREYPLFHLGMADWVISSSQQSTGNTENRINLNLGGLIAGGETTVLLNYSSKEPINPKHQFYQWRYANNENQLIRQTTAGKIFSQSTSSIYAPIVGFQLSNTPTTYRKSFGTYNISDHTEPNWIVELYVNNILVDYKKADASGFYAFEVPLIYGNSDVKLKFYGPYGEERLTGQNIVIPFSFLPAKELEYTFSAGIVEDDLHSKYSRAEVNYGLNNWITLGGGLEYLSSISGRKSIPFASSSFRLSSNLLFNSQLDYGVRFNNILTYNLPGSVQFEMNYASYTKGQQAINNNFRNVKKLMLSLPVHLLDFKVFSRMTYSQVKLENSQYSSGEMMLTGVVKGIGTSLSTNILMNDFSKPFIYSNLSLSYRMPFSIMFNPQAQYNYSQNQIVSMRMAVEKNVAKNGFLNLTYEQNFKSQLSNFSLGFRYDFNFAQASALTRQGNYGSSYLQSARGSLIYDPKSSYLGLNNRTNVGKGGLIISTFLDINGNGTRDVQEPLVNGLKFKANGGRIVSSKKDSVTRVFDLEPYVDVLLQLDPNSLDNISWQLDLKTIKVSVIPNQLKTVELPVRVSGEISGMVYQRQNQKDTGLGRILVCIYTPDDFLVARTLSESDGYFSYLGLKSGDYYATIDTGQLHRLNMNSSVEKIPFEIKNTTEGDVKENFEFILQSKQIVIEEKSGENSAEEYVVPAEEKTAVPAKVLKKYRPAPKFKVAPAAPKSINKKVETGTIKKSGNHRSSIA
ncbi:MAG: hypothetical protein ABI390_07370 [Daejeonella sp.]